MFTECLILTISLSGISPIAGGGDTYVFTSMGPWTEPICRESHSIDLELDDLLAGVQDNALCVEGGATALAGLEAGVMLTECGFSVMIDGWGDAIGDGIEDVFSRHDVTSYVEFAIDVDHRFAVDWSMQSYGLASAGVQLQRLGDIDGPLEPSPPAFEHSVSTYIEPLELEGREVLFIPSGRWNLRLLSTHQAMDEQEGFTQASVSGMHAVTCVALGDVDGDGHVGVTDLLTVIGTWGPCVPTCQADLDASGTIDVTDLLQVISDWN